MITKTKMPVTDSRAAAAVLRPTLEPYPEQEAFVALALNSRNHVIGEPWIVGVGTVGQVNVHPRDVFREAIRRNAFAVIIAHNHPSGDVLPSDDDHACTAKLKAAGDLVGIPVLDHLILTADAHYSILTCYAETNAAAIVLAAAEADV